MEESMNQNAGLTREEKIVLKRELEEAWPELPRELREFVIEALKQKLKALYMLEDWAKKNGHETMLGLLSRKIVLKEDKIQEMEKSL